MWTAVLAVATGAALGALARWGLSNALNGMFPQLPPGTLVANLVGGYGIGLAMALFAQAPQLPPAVAPLRHHRLPGRPDDLLHLLGRGRDGAAAGPHRLGADDRRRAPGRLGADDAGRPGHTLVAAPLSRSPDQGI